MVQTPTRDGERIIGLAPVYSEARQFFFVVPADARSNNLRILVNRAASESLTLLAPPS